jgi:hypothetical protein
MENIFWTDSFFIVCENDLSEFAANDGFGFFIVDLRVLVLRECGSHCGVRCVIMCKKMVHSGIGFVNGNAHVTHQGGKCRFAHADRSGEAEHNHARILLWRSDVICGITPYHNLKAGRAD